MTFVDTHSHLYAEEFNDDLEATVQRAKENRVDTILLPNIDSTSVNAMHNLADKWPGIFRPMMGLHPCSVKPGTYRQELDRVKDALYNGRAYIAVGEIGMDLYWDKTTRSEQEEALIEQCKWANDLKLPIAIHSRNATNEVIAIIEQLNLPDLTGVFHCFGDGLGEAEKIIELGFYLGIGGVLTFKNSGLGEVIKQVDLAHLILETDSPYLAPVPYRGKRNESGYIPLIAEKLADVKQVSLEEVAKITTQNAVNLFRI